MNHQFNHQQLQKMANAIRVLAMDGVQAANSGHPGMPMGMADVATVLFSQFIKLNPANAAWQDRDRFVLSAGHGSMLLYALNYLLGYPDMTMDQLKQFRQLGAITAGHPEYGHALGVETTTGPLGQGLATSVGMALAEAMTRAKFGAPLCDHYTYVIAGDGCLQEGISHEAIDFAGHLKLRKLIVLWDDNQISIDGATGLSTSMNQQMRFKAAGWDVQTIDGHDFDAIHAALEKARASRKPSLIACKTVIGKGAPNLQGSEKTHGAPLGAAEITAAKAQLGWDAPAFTIPQEILNNWRQIATHGASAEQAWQERLEASPKAKRYHKFTENALHPRLNSKLNAFRKTHFNEQTKVATRKASQMVLELLTELQDNLIGGSADLTGSNLTKTKQTEAITPNRYRGRYIHYGIREHGMAAMMNGLALHGGYRPYGGTFLVFTDYARGAIRLSALMGLNVIYVMTHDSIGLGEDGPTHQPVEHLAMLRATPNLNVYRPADIIETAECWQDALEQEQTPSILALSRQGLPMVRTHHSQSNLSAMGAYVIYGDDRKARDATLIATGSEVAIAIEASKQLAAQHQLNCPVISMPCMERFAAQSSDYQQQILGSAPRFAIEAAVSFGWERWLNPQTQSIDPFFIGMNGFGTSAPLEAVYQHFEITAETIIHKVINNLS